MIKTTLLGLLLTFGLTVSAFGQAPPDIYFNSFEFPDMRVENADTISILGANEEPNQPAGVCQGVANSGVCTAINSKSFFQDVLTFTNDPANCHNGSAWCMVGALPAGLIGGPPPNGTEGHHTAAFGRTHFAVTPTTMDCSTGGQDYPQGTSSCFTYNVFYSFWYKWTNGYEANLSNGGDGTNNCFGKIAYISGFTLTTRPGFVISFRLTGNNQFRLFIDNNPFGSNSWFVNTDGQWHNFEVNANWTTGIVNVWQDGVQVVTNFQLGIFDPLTTEDGMEWGMFFNQPGNGNCQTANPITFWVDDFAVSTQRIGASGGTPAAPGTPSNLNVVMIAAAGLATAMMIWRRR